MIFFTTLLLAYNFSDIFSPEVTVELKHEVFGFAPYWKIRNMENVDFSVLTTYAYFGIEALPTGELNRNSNGYRIFMSEEASRQFTRAKQHKTRVVLTITQMDSGKILELLDDRGAQRKLINETVALVERRDIGGVNIDFEYFGESKTEYRDDFSKFVKNMTEAMHALDEGSRVTVSLYASAARNPRIYDIESISANSDGIFMMAYDFATAASDKVMPTSPLYGYAQGKYWYDISTAVEDFLTQMPSEKLILGLPWYGYNYPVTSPTQDVRHAGYYSYYWRWGYRYSYFVYPEATAQTNGEAAENAVLRHGWDDVGKVGWIAYKKDGMWRKIYLENEKSLSIKYDFAIKNDLGGIGIWALGYGKDRGLWVLLNDKFGTKLADTRQGR